MFIKCFGVVSRGTPTPLHHRELDGSAWQRWHRWGVAAHAHGSAAAGRRQSQGAAVARASGQFGVRRWRGCGASWARCCRGAVERRHGRVQVKASAALPKHCARRCRRGTEPQQHLGRLAPWACAAKNGAAACRTMRAKASEFGATRYIFCSARPRRQAPQMRPRRAAAPPAPRPEPPACPCHGSALTLHAASGRAVMGARSSAPPAPVPPGGSTWPPVVQRGRRST